MKAVILAGGKGTRITELTENIPKPLIEVHGRPLIWWIMKHLSSYNITEFIILTGYKGEKIREYFANFWLNQSDITFSLNEQSHEVIAKRGPDWTVTVIDTGLETMTGGRLLRARSRIGEEPFLLTYGDGVSDVDINEVLKIHTKTESWITLTAVRPPGRFGALVINQDSVTSFTEKPEGDGDWINGGFMIVNPLVLKDELDDNSVFEVNVMTKVATAGRLSCYKHEGMWQPVDTLRDLRALTTLLESESRF